MYFSSIVLEYGLAYRKIFVILFNVKYLKCHIIILCSLHVTLNVTPNNKRVCSTLSNQYYFFLFRSFYWICFVFFYFIFIIVAVITYFEFLCYSWLKRPSASLSFCSFSLIFLYHIIISYIKIERFLKSFPFGAFKDTTKIITR